MPPPARTAAVARPAAARRTGETPPPSVSLTGVATGVGGAVGAAVGAGVTTKAERSSGASAEATAAPVFTCTRKVRAEAGSTLAASRSRMYWLRRAWRSEEHTSEL